MLIKHIIIPIVAAVLMFVGIHYAGLAIIAMQAK